jgi:hypothetical protein
LFAFTNFSKKYGKMHHYGAIEAPGYIVIGILIGVWSFARSNIISFEDSYWGLASVSITCGFVIVHFY